MVNLMVKYLSSPARHKSQMKGKKGGGGGELHSPVEKKILLKPVFFELI